MLSFLVALCLQGPVSPPCRDRDTISLGVGTQKIVSMNAPSRLRASNPGVVELEMIGKSQLLVIGASEGSTTVWLDEDAGVRNFHVVVRKSEGCVLTINELAKLFPCGSTLELKLVGDRIYLDGEASSLEEWTTAFAVLKEYPGVVMLGHLKPDVVEHTFVEADAALMRAGLGRLRWARAGESVHLAGERAVDDAAKIAALEAQWRPTLEMVLSRPRGAKPPAHP